jgi:hypothetical protein
MWVLMLISLLMTHVAVAGLIGPLGDLPDNLRKGFYSELKFDYISADGLTVKAEAEDAMIACGATLVECEAGTLETMCNSQANILANQARCSLNIDNSAHLGNIQNAFSNSLDIIRQVASDPFFGVDGLADTAGFLDEIVAEMDQLATVTTCGGQNHAYCTIYQQADLLVDGASEATDAVDTLFNNGFINDFEDFSDNLPYLHGLPYILIISMLFFTCFWWKDAACFGCGGSFLGSLAMTMHWLTWIASFILSCIIWGTGYALQNEADRVEIKGTFKEDTNLRALLDHISVAYPGFWSIVITPLEDPMMMLYNAFGLFLIFCIILFFYGWGTCLCRPYTESNKVGPEDAGAVDVK